MGLDFEVQIKTANRLTLLPPYLFAELDRLKREVQQKGIDVISLGIGDPDLPTPAHIVEALKRTAEIPANHRYPDYQGLDRFREAVCGWYQRRFGVKLDPSKDACALIGSKEGIANFSVGIVDPQDVVLIPDPGYPVYYSGCVFNGGEPYFMPLRKEHAFLPELTAIPAEVARRAKLMWLNYPNNPTAAVAEPEFLRRAVKFCLENGIILAFDIAYSEIAFDGYRAPSVLQIDGARECAIEFHSLSKTFSMTGWRVGFALGNAQLVGALGTVKTNVDSGVFQPVQEAAIAALEGGDQKLHEYCAIYQERRDMMVAALQGLGLECERPRATFYLWTKTPKGYNSVSFTERVLKETGVVITPGSGFGKSGEGYVRFSLTVSSERLKEAVGRIKALRF
jgi:LL-diaminopimelate aminotransferase